MADINPVPAEHAFNSDRGAECIAGGGKILVIQNSAVVVLNA